MTTTVTVPPNMADLLPAGAPGDLVAVHGAAPTARPTTPGGRLVTTFDAWDPVAADKLPCLKAIMEDAANADRRLEVPPGSYGLAYSAAPALPQPGVWLAGAGRASRFAVTGFDPTAGTGAGLSCFGSSQSPGSATPGWRFSDLAFVGERTGSTFYQNKQATVIGGYGASDSWPMHAAPDDDILYSDSLATDLVVERCTFQDLWGFGVNTYGYERRTVIRDNTFLRVYNGANANSFYVIYRNNTFDGDAVGGEGIETAGWYAIVEGNRVFNYTAVGIGVNNMAGATNHGAATVAGNAIVRARANGLTTSALIASTGAGRSRIQGNLVGWPYQVGIQVGLPSGEGTYGPSDGCTLLGNTVLSPGESAAPAGSQVGIAVYRNNTRVLANLVENTGTAGYGPVGGIYVAGSDCTLDHNEVKGAFAYAQFRLMPQSGSAYAGAFRTYFGGGNRYDNASAAGLRVDGGDFAGGSLVRFGPSGLVKPAASATWRGVTALVRGGAGAADTVEIATKDAADAYAWRTLI